MDEIALAVILIGAVLIGIINGLIIVKVYTWIERRRNFKEWYRRTEISDQEINSIKEKLNK